jgi:hypothetical protein
MIQNRLFMRRGPGGPVMGPPGMMPGEKPKDLKKDIDQAAAISCTPIKLLC